MGANFIVVIDRTADGGTIAVEIFQPNQEAKARARYTELVSARNANIYFARMLGQAELAPHS